MSKTTIPTGGLTDAAVTTAKITDANITTAKIADDAVTSAKSTAGITVADAWRITTAFTDDADPIASNWERWDAYGFGQLGTGMTESSGIFTFPSTGIYRISFHVYFYLNGDDRLMETKIKTTTNNSDYNFLSDGVSFIQQTGGALTYANSHNEGVFDVTNTTTHKCAFRVNVANSSTAIAGDSNIAATYATFIRLGDT
jgi:hypothetical protein